MSLCFFFFLQRTEMVKLQLDTYTTDTISAHRKIRQDLVPLLLSNTGGLFQSPHHNRCVHPCCREKLELELKSSKEEKQAAEVKLSSFKILGEEFEALANEYCRLRQEIDIRKWALKELSHYKKN